MSTPVPDRPVPDRPALPRTDDPRAVFRTALRFMLVLLGALLVAGVGIGAAVAGWPGVWGGLLGVGLALVFSGTTVVSVMRTTGVDPIRMVSVVAVTWLVKMLVVFVALAVLSRFHFYDRYVLAAVLLAGVIGSAVLDYRAVATARVPYVDVRQDEGRTVSGPGDEGA